MAVDTVSDRRSMLALSSPGVLPIPDTLFDQNDRAVFGRFYGLAAETVSTGTATITFQPPVAAIQPRVLPNTKGPARRLWSHYSSRPVGQTVLRIAGVYGTYSTPTAVQVASASEVYVGGHLYEVSESTAAALRAAGYGGGLS